MKVLKILAIAILVYVGIVAAFESMIGFFQPTPESTLVIVVQNDDGTPHDRVVARLENEGRLYVAANHWPRAWYRQALEHPEVEVRSDNENGAYRAIPISGEEAAAVDRANSLPLPFRFVTGFPPRLFLRLDPR